MKKLLLWIKSLFAKKLAPISPVELPKLPDPVPDTPQEVINIPPKLSWERYPENRPWSEYLYSMIHDYFIETFLKAKDLDRLHPRFQSLSRHEKIWVFCELFSSMAFYESGWNEKSASQDVGTAENKDTWSIGLMQISVVDQKNMGLSLHYTYNDLLQAKPNLHLALTIMARQINKTGLVILPNKSPQRYWAVLLDGNRYSQVSQILKRIQTAVP